MRLGIVAYIVPFVFVFHPALIFVGTAVEIILTFFTASAGVVLLGIGCAGYLFRPLGWGRRAWTWAAAAFLIMPPTPALPVLVADALGLGLGALFVAVEWTA